MQGFQTQRGSTNRHHAKGIAPCNGVQVERVAEQTLQHCFLQFGQRQQRGQRRLTALGSLQRAGRLEVDQMKPDPPVGHCLQVTVVDRVEPGLRGGHCLRAEEVVLPGEGPSWQP